MKPILQIPSTLCSTDLGKVQTTMSDQIVNQNIDDLTKPLPRHLSQYPQEMEDTLSLDLTLGINVATLAAVTRVQSTRIYSSPNAPVKNMNGAEGNVLKLFVIILPS